MARPSEAMNISSELMNPPINSDGIFINLNEKFIRVDGFIIKRGQNPSGSGDERSRRNETSVRFLHDSARFHRART
jgi:hypothetical protein